MITKNTVFVLGAGASADFGYPLGNDLRKRIIEKFKGENDAVHELGTALGEFPHDASDYYDTITNFATRLDHACDFSIDEFLERHQKSFLRIGKLAIAYILAQCEDNDKLRQDRSWYKTLLHEMKRNTSLDTFGQNKISFITFNYDRSLEHFLYTALIAYDEKIRKEHVIEILNQIPIIHLYGQLDPLPWQHRDGREYGRKFTPAQLKSYQKQINIVFEDFQGRVKENFQRAFELLTEAERIYILGFGWYPENISRLKLRDLEPEKTVGTSYGLGNQENEKIISDFRKAWTSKTKNVGMMGISEIKLFQSMVYDFVQNHIVLD
jgi:hypothetical protein